MNSIWLGGQEVEVAEILAEQHLQVVVLEIQIAGLQEYLETRHELIEWLTEIAKED